MKRKGFARDIALKSLFTHWDKGLERKQIGRILWMINGNN